MSQWEKPSTAAGNWLWNERRRISPSVTTSSARILLAAQRRVDGCVLDALEAGGRQLSPLQGLLCGEELRRAEETADDIAPRYHVPSLLRVCNTGAPSDDGTFAPLPFREARVRLMRDILVVCPQERDLQAIRAAGLDARYKIHFVGGDLDAIDLFDPAAFVAETDAIPADGVIGTKDRSALLAALIAERRGLPGPSPRALIACQFKPTARALQRATIPAATPRFALLDGRPPFGPPFFVKPVVGRLSQRARRIDHPAEIERLEDVDDYMTGYARIAELAGLHPDAVRGFLAEELLNGKEVTLEGYVHGGETTSIGVTDSVKYPGTNSFARFEYPSALSPERQAELSDATARVVRALGFDEGFFNVEFFIPSDGGAAQIIEVNARISSQFWPLVEAVDGQSTYEALFELACRR